MKTVSLSRSQRMIRILTLVVLSPVIAEVLFGATHISMLYLLIPQICIYGGAALIIRTLARHRGWSAILILGIAYAVAEECIILQTSVSPPYQHLLFGRAPNQNYLGTFGINWGYLFWALGYESIWAILLPIQITELIFLDRREEPWIGQWGLLITAIMFLIPSYGIWYTFTQTGIAPGLAYEAPLPLILISLAIIVALAVFALVGLRPRRSQKNAVCSVPRPWFVGVIGFLLSLPWFSLAILPYLVPPTIPTAISIMIGLIWAVFAFLLIRRWSSSSTWQDSHRLALSIGALLASMLAGFLINGPVLSPFDLAGKIVVNVIAMMLLASLARSNRRQSSTAKYLTQ
jgi:putative flippase GtrA